MLKLLTSITLLSTMLTATPSEAACMRNEYGVYEDIACAFDAYAAADKELNEVYKVLLGKLEESEKTKLRDAQKAWVAYKEKNAVFVYAIEGDGSAGRLVVANQGERSTRARIEELRNWIH